MYVDDRPNHNPGFKFNDWELKGTPVRIELGMKDFNKQEVKIAVRHSGEKFFAPWEGLNERLEKLLEDIHTQMFEKAKNARDEHLKEVSTWEEFMDALNHKNICLAPWCDVEACEDQVKDRSKEESLQYMLAHNEEEAVLTGSAKTLCIPHTMGKQDFTEADGVKCFHCGKPATVTALWGRSY